MNRILVFVAIVIATWGIAQAKSPTAALKHTSITYSQKTWHFVMSNTDAQGGANLSIKFRNRPIAVGISERPDSTTLMLSSVLLKQMEDSQKKSMYRFETANANSLMYTLRMPDGWSCQHHIAESKKDANKPSYYSHCVWIGSGYWNYVVVVAPLDVTSSEVSQMNKVLMSVTAVGN